MPPRAFLPHGAPLAVWGDAGWAPSNGMRHAADSPGRWTPFQRAPSPWNGEPLPTARGSASTTDVDDGRRPSASPAPGVAPRDGLPYGENGRPRGARETSIYIYNYISILSRAFLPGKTAGNAGERCATPRRGAASWPPSASPPGKTAGRGAILR